MPDHLFRFRTVWHVAAPLPAVWDVIVKSHEYPRWWPGVARVDVVAGRPWPMEIGTRMAYEVRSPLYTLHYTTELKSYTEHRSIFATSEGDLVGTGTWTFTEHGNITEAVFEWNVAVTPAFLKTVSYIPGVPLIMRFFHTRLMKDGEHGLQRLLSAGS